jgi:hypothetical protein
MKIKGDFGRFQVMLRIVSSIVAVAAILAIPSSQADGNFIRSGSVIGSNKVFISHRRIHHRRFPVFVGVGAYGLYDTCWRWVPTAYGLRRVWVCDPYSYY